MDYLINVTIGLGLMSLSVGSFLLGAQAKDKRDNHIGNRLFLSAIFAMLLAGLFFYSKSYKAPVLYRVEITAGPDGPVVGTVTLRENPEGD